MIKSQGWDGFVGKVLAVHGRDFDTNKYVDEKQKNRGEETWIWSRKKQEKIETSKKKIP